MMSALALENREDVLRLCEQAMRLFGTDAAAGARARSQARKAAMEMSARPAGQAAN